MHVDELPTQYNHLHYCTSEYNGVVLYAEPYCSNFQWRIEGTQYQNLDSVVITATEYTGYHHVSVEYAGCGFYRTMYIHFHSSDIPNPFGESVAWMHPGDTLTFSIPWDDNDYEWEWSNGSTDYGIEVTEPGIYSISIESLHDCGSATYFVEVRDNVEIESASVDPESNKNLVTWKVTPAQAEYISNVIINRDGVDLVTVPYINGQYLDNIGSDLAARIYTVTGVSVEGTPCPIPSFERGTIHMAFLPDINGNVEMTWNSPELGGANIHVGRYEICEYDPNGKGGITVIDFVGPSTMSYSCNQSMFDYGYPLIRAIIQDGRGEKDMLSNRTEEIVGLGEKENKFFNLYPNPTTGRVTIEGTGRLTITNTLGQTVLTRDITDTETIDLPMGVWFVNLNGATRKVVVE